MGTADLLLDTLRLRHEIPAEILRSAWTTTDTRGLRQLLALEGVPLWLYKRLEQVGAANTVAVDQGLLAWLKRSARYISARNLLVDESTDLLLRILVELDVPHVLLKGTARRTATHIYPHVDSRATSDIDILVPAECAQTLWERLERRGYAYDGPPRTLPPGYHELLPLTDPSGVPIDIHISTIPAVDPGEAWRRATTGGSRLLRNSLPTRISSATELMWHGATHALRHGLPAYRLRFFLDSASIMASEELIDWDLVNPRLDSAEVPGRDRTVAWLGAAAWLAGTELPEEISRGVPPFPLHRIMRWRLSVLRRFHASSRMAEKLLDEGTRCEAGMPLTPSVRTTALPVRMRRVTAAFAARLAYLGWRLTVFGETAE